MKNSNEILEKLVALFREDIWDYDGALVERQLTDASALDQLYSKLPAKFPKLYEQLVLNYRWQGADVGRLRFLLNPPGPDLSGLEEKIFCDKWLSEGCLKGGYGQFAQQPGGMYDPVCFDTKKRTADGDYPIVQLDHEQILCNSRIKVIELLAPSFEGLVMSIVSSAK